MEKELIITRANDFFKAAKKQIKETGSIQSGSILFYENDGLMEEMILASIPMSEKSIDKNEQQAHFDLVMTYAKRLDALAVVHIGEVWIREKITVDKKNSKVVNPLPLSCDPNRMEALLMVISMPGFSVGTMQPYSEIGERIVLGEEISFELNESSENGVCNCFVDLWESDDDVDKEVNCRFRSMKNLQSYKN